MYVCIEISAVLYAVRIEGRGAPSEVVRRFRAILGESGRSKQNAWLRVGAQGAGETYSV